MKSTLATILVVMSCLAGSAPVHDESVVMERLSKLIGGKWVGTAGSGPNAAAIEFTFKRHPDKKGIVGEGIIGKGSANPVYADVTLGWDAKAGKVYYLDLHNTSTIYYGHIVPDGEGLLYEFGVLGGDLKAFRIRDRFLDADTQESDILDKDGKSIVKVVRKRVRE